MRLFSKGQFTCPASCRREERKRKPACVTPVYTVVGWQATTRPLLLGSFNYAVIRSSLQVHFMRDSASDAVPAAAAAHALAAMLLESRKRKREDLEQTLEDVIETYEGTEERPERKKRELWATKRSASTS